MNKLTFQKGSGDNVLTYPITQEQLDNLKPSQLVNPKVGKSYGLKMPEGFDVFESAAEILMVRLQVLNNIYPEAFMRKYWPYKFEMPTYLPQAFIINGLTFDNPQGLADIVHMDDPLDLPLSLKKVLTNPRYGGTANVKEHTIIYKQFLETVVDSNETITDFQKRYGHRVFELKSFFGLARPEEVLPELAMYLTAYPEGCPCHGAIGQGHMALAQAGVRALNHVYDLSKDKVQDSLYTAYLWGQFRCLAGVHHGIDAIMSIIMVGGFDKYIKREVLKDYQA